MELARDSFERAVASGDFFRSFYERFFAACPEAEPLFAETDFERQHRLLRHAIGLLLVYPGQSREEPAILERIAERHSRSDLSIDPSLYEPFIDSLVDTLSDYDPEFSPATESAWRETLAPGVDYMKSHY